jgi:hypothetical protein
MALIESGDSVPVEQVREAEAGPSTAIRLPPHGDDSRRHAGTLQTAASGSQYSASYGRAGLVS